MKIKLYSGKCFIYLDFLGNVMGEFELGIIPKLKIFATYLGGKGVGCLAKENFDGFCQSDKTPSLKFLDSTYQIQ